MSEMIGRMTLDGGGRTGLLPGPPPREQSEDPARLSAAEARRILVAAHGTVSALLTEKRSLLAQLARRRLEKEVVEREELQALLARAQPS